MGRRRKIFTKREYEKLSKTYEGRQKINLTYATLAILAFCGSLGFVIFSYFSELLEQIRAFAYIALIISALIALIFICLYFSEKAEEKIRIEQLKAAQKRRVDEINAKIEYENHLAKLKFQEEQERLKKFKNSNMEEIDQMAGYQFETFISEILKDIGYSATTTKKSGDFGVDIIVEKNNEKVIIQTKRYTKKVSINAIQEITSAKNYYQIQDAWVVTNNYFTEPAKQLAKANNVKLIDRDELANIIIKAKNIRETEIKSA